MIPNITRGDRMPGLLAYLAGPGRSNEHTEPHLVTGDPAMMAWHDDAVLDKASTQDIARALDRPRRLLDVEVAGGSVWHCSLSLRPEEGQLSDEVWASIAQDFVAEMGFADLPGTDPDQGSGKAPCRWVAVRHGVSTGGNDHIHLAVSLVREDGTKADAWNDQPRAQKIAGRLERKYGLEVLESRAAGRGQPGLTPAEIARTAREGAVEPARRTVERTVRAAATAAADEAEFVRRARRSGLLVRPRYAAGRTDVVAGYSAALRPPAGEQVVWYGGGQLARDLTLPRLRLQWPDTPQAATAAAAEWNAARRQQRPAAPGRETTEVDPALWESYTSEVAALRERLRAVPVEDRGAWAQVAHETAGAFAAWSHRVEAVPGPLAATADALGGFAGIRAHQVPAKPTGSVSMRGAALMLSAAVDSGRGQLAQAVMLRQLANTMKAMHDAHAAVGEARSAARIAAVVHTQLAAVAARLPDPAPVMALAGAPGAGQREAALRARAVAAQGAVPLRAPGSPVPGRLRPGQTPARSGQDVDRGLGQQVER